MRMVASTRHIASNIASVLAVDMVAMMAMAVAVAVAVATAMVMG